MTRATPRLRYSDGKQYPVTVTSPDEAEKERRLALRAVALELVDGDARRLQTEPDGSITILDRPRRIFLASEPQRAQRYFFVRLWGADLPARKTQKEIPKFI
jgi:hypothetical protein